MTVILFRLSGVPDDEAQEIRALLKQNGIDYYETPGGRWGLSLAAIWLQDTAQLKRARHLIDEYEHARAARMRTEYAQLKQQGKQETILDRIKEDPIRFILYLAIIVLIVYVSTIPFLDLGQ